MTIERDRMEAGVTHYKERDINMENESLFNDSCSNGYFISVLIKTEAKR